MPAEQMTRKRNPRGQGERLRDDIIEAVQRLDIIHRSSTMSDEQTHGKPGRALGPRRSYCTGQPIRAPRLASACGRIR